VTRERAVRPVDAAGLVLVRDLGRGPEILMGRRHRRASFLPDIYVFPGGRVDPGDSRPSCFSETISAAVVRELGRVGRRDPAAFLRAAVRETFEETGLLLAGPTASGAEAHPARPPSRGAVWRAFAGIGAVPGFAGMDYICRAITPTSSRRRYDTRFFLADGTGAAGELGGDGELEDIGWRSVAEAARLPSIEVTQFVLGEALRRWTTGTALGSEPPPLFSYRSKAATTRRRAGP
jgi:8-oxo-dGTP pyrophosphatase MutT (NUDIX family)